MAFLSLEQKHLLYCTRTERRALLPGKNNCLAKGKVNRNEYEFVFSGWYLNRNGDSSIPVFLNAPQCVQWISQQPQDVGDTSIGRTGSWQRLERNQWNAIKYIKHMTSRCMTPFHLLHSGNYYEPFSPLKHPVVCLLSDSVGLRMVDFLNINLPFGLLPLPCSISSHLYTVSATYLSWAWLHRPTHSYMELCKRIQEAPWLWWSAALALYAVQFQQSTSNLKIRF